jgi:hypothetical protein
MPDRAELLATLNESLSAAEGRIDSGIARALEAEKERSEIELALVRDEVLNIIAEKKYGQPSDDAPKLELAEKAIARLRRSLGALEQQSAKHGAAVDEIGALREELAALAAAHKETTTSLMIRRAANVIAAKAEAKRSDELANKVATLEKTMAKLIGTLIERKLIE